MKGILDGSYMPTLNNSVVYNQYIQYGVSTFRLLTFFGAIWIQSRFLYSSCIFWRIYTCYYVMQCTYSYYYVRLSLSLFPSLDFQNLSSSQNMCIQTQKAADIPRKFYLVRRTTNRHHSHHRALFRVTVFFLFKLGFDYVHSAPTTIEQVRIIRNIPTSNRFIVSSHLFILDHLPTYNNMYMNVR